MALQHYQRRHLEGGSVHLWVVIILVIVILVLLGLVFWQQLAKQGNIDNSKRDTTLQSDSDIQNNIGSSETKTYTPISGRYVKSLKYPANWQVVDGAGLCDTFDYCVSPPDFIILDQAEVVRVEFYGPQVSSDDTTIDDEVALLTEASGGEIAPDFTSLDGVPAREIQLPDGTVDVRAKLDDGLSAIFFHDSVDRNDINTILSAWKWQ